MRLRNYLIAGAAALGMAMPGIAGAQTLAQVTTDLNLRAGPGTQHGVITSMPRGSQVHVHQCPGSWCQVTYAGHTGWASQRYLGTTVAMHPQPRTFAAQPRVHLGVEVGPRFRHAAPFHGPFHGRHVMRTFPHHHPTHWWRTAHPGWYGDVFYDGRRWWHGDRWHDRPRFGFGITFGG